MAGELTPKDKVEWELLSTDMVWPSVWPVWVSDMLKRMEAVELPALHWIPVDSRLWVAKVCYRIIVSVCSTVAKPDPSISGACFLGRLVGHQLECIQLVDESWAKAEQQIEELNNRVRQKLSAKAYARLIKRGERYQRDFKKFLEVFAELKKKKMALCLEAQAVAARQPREESADFSIGLGEARGCPIVGKQGEPLIGGNRLKLYLLLLIFWRFVEKFNSSVELHRWCERWLGKNEVGEISSFHRLCRSYSIRLGARGKRVSKRRMRRRKRTR